MNSFLLSVAKYRREADAQRMGWLGARRNTKIKKIFCCFIHIFNSFNSFLCFRSVFSMILQYVTRQNPHQINENPHQINENPHKINENPHKINLDFTTKIIYNNCIHHLKEKVNKTCGELSNIKKGWTNTPKIFKLIWRI